MDAEAEVVVDVVDSDGLEGRGQGGSMKIRKEGEGRKAVKKEKGTEKKRRQEGRKGHTCLSQCPSSSLQC